MAPPSALPAVARRPRVASFARCCLPRWAGGRGPDLPPTLPVFPSPRPVGVLTLPCIAHRPWKFPFHLKVHGQDAKSVANHLSKYAPPLCGRWGSSVIGRAALRWIRRPSPNMSPAYECGTESYASHLLMPLYTPTSYAAQCRTPPPPFARTTPLVRTARGVFSLPFGTIWGWGWYFGDTDCRPTTHFDPFLFLLEVGIGQSPDDQYIPDATVTACVFSRCAPTPPCQSTTTFRFRQIQYFYCCSRSGGEVPM